jgi:hypothetical protein
MRVINVKFLLLIWINCKVIVFWKLYLTVPILINC